MKEVVGRKAKHMPDDIGYLEDQIKERINKPPIGVSGFSGSSGIGFSGYSSSVYNPGYSIKEERPYGTLYVKSMEQCGWTTGHSGVYSKEYLDRIDDIKRKEEKNRKNTDTFVKHMVAKQLEIENKEAFRIEKERQLNEAREQAIKEAEVQRKLRKNFYIKKILKIFDLELKGESIKDYSIHLLKQGEAR